MSLHSNYSTLDGPINAEPDYLPGSVSDDTPMMLNQRDLFGNIFDFDTDFGTYFNLDTPVQTSILKDWDDAESNLLGDSLAPLTPTQPELESNKGFYLDVETPIQSYKGDTQPDFRSDNIAPLIPNHLESAGNNSSAGTSYYTPYSYWSYSYFNGYGTPLQDSLYWRQQKNQYSCAVVAQASVYQSITGQFISEKRACQMAAAGGWYDPASGTPLRRIGRLLRSWGIPATRNFNATSTEMLDALAAGNKVIAGVDGNEIWKPLRDSFTGAIVEQVDSIHAVWVTGLDPEPDGSWKVIMNDSGSAYGQMDAVDFNDFLNAWADTDYFMMAAAAPGQPLLWA